MRPSITHIEKCHFRSYYTLFESVAAEGRYFVRNYAPKCREMKSLVWDALERNLPFYVALEEKTVTGFAKILFPTLPALAHSGTLVTAVSPSHRRRGIGKLLLDSCLTHAFSNPKHLRIQLEVFCDNEAAIALYTGRGFASEGIAKRAVRLEDGLKDVMHMALFREMFTTKAG